MICLFVLPFIDILGEILEAVSPRRLFATVLIFLFFATKCINSVSQLKQDIGLCSKSLPEVLFGRPISIVNYLSILQGL